MLPRQPQALPNLVSPSVFGNPIVLGEAGDPFTAYLPSLGLGLSISLRSGAGEWPGGQGLHTQIPTGARQPTDRVGGMTDRP